jgi:hypothetical protein
VVDVDVVAAVALVVVDDDELDRCDGLLERISEPNKELDEVEEDVNDCGNWIGLLSLLGAAPKPPPLVWCARQVTRI